MRNISFASKFYHIFYIWVCCLCILCAQEPTYKLKDINLIAYDKDFFKLINKEAKAYILYDEGIWLEGPVILPDKSLIFSDVKANRVLHYTEDKGVSIYISPSHFQNGHTLDKNNQLLAASHGKRAIEWLHNGEWKILVDSYKGKKLNSPNDLIVDKYGNIYFTDPAFGIKNPQESYGGEIEQEGEYVYRYSPKNKILTRLHTPLIKAPNGLALSPDGKTLYIADSQRAYDSKDLTLNSFIVAYSLAENGNLTQERVFASLPSGFPDGIKVDSLGNVWSSSGNGVLVFSKKGKLLGEIELGSVVGNLALGMDKDGNRLVYILASHELIKIKLNN